MPFEHRYAMMKNDEECLGCIDTCFVNKHVKSPFAKPSYKDNLHIEPSMNPLPHRKNTYECLKLRRGTTETATALRMYV